MTRKRKFVGSNCTHGSHELEVKTGTTDQTVHHDASRNGLYLRKVLVDELGYGLERFGSGLVASVLASPFAAHPIERHGAIGKWDGSGGHVAGEGVAGVS